MNVQDCEKDSVLSGVDELIDQWLGIKANPRYGNTDTPAYASKTAAIDLSNNNGPLVQADSKISGTSLLHEMLETIDQNWQAMGCRPHLSSMWKLRKALQIADECENPENMLNQLVVRLLDETWFNQIPTGCGLAENQEFHWCVDLGHDCGEEEFELIELKYGTAAHNFGSAYPLYAAWEIVQYGLLYAHTRAKELWQDVAERNTLLRAKSVHLRVLAPSGYYHYKERDNSTKRFEFKWLEQNINEGLRTLQIPVELDFQFQQFTPEFDALYNQPISLIEGVRAFQRSRLQNREPVFR